METFWKIDRPSLFLAIDGQAYFGATWRMVPGLSKDEEIGSKLSNRKDTAIEQQTNANMGGMAGHGDIGCRRFSRWEPVRRRMTGDCANYIPHSMQVFLQESGHGPIEDPQAGGQASAFRGHQ
jgi:hypothetical protein